MTSSMQANVCRWMDLKPWRSTPWSLKGPKALAGGVLVDSGWLIERKVWRDVLLISKLQKNVNTGPIVGSFQFFSEGLWRFLEKPAVVLNIFFGVFLRVWVASSIKKIMLTTPMNAPLMSIDTTSTFQSSERASTSESQLGVIKLHRHCWKIHRRAGRAQFWVVQV